MLLKDLLKDIVYQEISLSLDTEITALTHESRGVLPGALYIAIRGLENDGNNYIGDAVAAGAACVMTEFKPKGGVPYVLVADVRAAMARAAGNFFGNAHKDMKIAAVVGTNGKTTTAHMLGGILRAAGHKVTVLGTLGADIDGMPQEAGLTTPDPIELHRLFAESRAAGVTHFVYEVSAHAIALRKAEGITADVGIFTNFSQDHLDFFGSMEEYARVKRSFFRAETVRYAVINADDALGREIYDAGGFPMTTYGLYNPADTFAMDAVYENGTACVVNSCDDILELKTRFTGEFNLYNALAAVAAARALSVSEETVCRAFLKMPPVAGRFHLVEGRGKRAVVDFAHTPDGLKNLLVEARRICKGKLIVVFGCGGNRDPKKRAPMGEIAAKYADFTVLTSDNSRYENPHDIIRQIEGGHLAVSANYIKIAERAHAVEYAVLSAGREDLVVVAGKGGETYMEENGIKRPYSDKTVVEAAIAKYAAPNA